MSSAPESQGLLDSLQPKTKAALACFLFAKLCGLLSMVAMVIAATTNSAKYLPMVMGSLWGLFLVLSFVLAWQAHSGQKEDNERALLAKLKAKYED